MPAQFPTPETDPVAGPEVTAHALLTENVHGIADTAKLPSTDDYPAPYQSTSPESFMVTRTMERTLSKTDSGITSYHPLFVAMFPVELKDIMIVSKVALGPDASNYWTFTVNKWHGTSGVGVPGISATIATKTTKSDGVLPFWGYHIDMKSPNISQMTIGEVLGIRTSAVGTVADITTGLTVTMRLERI